MTDEQRKTKIPQASFTFDTSCINLDGILPEAEPRYDITFTGKSKRIWWQPWTWRRRTRQVTIEDGTLTNI